MKAVTYMILGASAALATESMMRNPMRVKKMARRTMRMFRM